MAHEKKWHLVCYDIRDPKRYRTVYRLLRGAGRPVQYSVFRCRLDARGLERLRWGLEKAMLAVDRLLIVELCPRCAARVVDRAEEDAGWAAAAPTHVILPALEGAPGTGATQAPAAREPPAARKPRKARALPRD